MFRPWASFSGVVPNAASAVFAASVESICFSFCGISTLRSGSSVFHPGRAVVPARGDAKRAFATGIAVAGFGVLLSGFDNFEVENSSLLLFDFQSGILP